MILCSRKRLLTAFSVLLLLAVSGSLKSANAQQVRTAVLRPMSGDTESGNKYADTLVRHFTRGTNWNVFSVKDPQDLAGPEQYADISRGKSPAAAATLGRILKANKVVSGRIKNFGDTVLINLALTDVLSSETENSFTYIGAAEGITEALKAAAAKLTGNPPPSTYTALEQREKSIRLTTEGVSFEANANPDKAIAAYEAALELDNTNSEARARLGELRVREAFAKKREERISVLHDKYLGETRKLIEEDKNEDALVPYGKVRAILHGKGDKDLSNRFAKEQWYVRMMGKLNALGTDHEKKAEWLEAYGIYSYLLIDNPKNEEYLEAIKRCNLNYGLENRYGKKLFREQSEKRLTPSIFDMHIRYGDYFDGKIDFKKAAVNSFKNIEFLLSNRKMRDYWPAISNADRVDDFKKGMKTISDAINDATKVEANDYRKALREIINLNRETMAIPDGVLVTEFIYGFTSVLDKHSNFFSELIYRTFVENAIGSFAGIGVQITARDGWLTVVVPLEDHPAIKVGVRAGDRISRVNGEKAYKMPLEEAVLKLRGKKGTPVTIHVIHRNDPNPKNPTEEEITIIRDIIKTNSVVGCAWNHKDKKWSYMADPVYGIAYIRIKSFQESTPDETLDILKELGAADRLNGLIIDLRYNSGGLMSAAVRISDMFLKDGVIVSSKGRRYRRTENLAYDDNAPSEKIPVVVLVNGASASASEILAAALRENDRALIVGEQSFGKGSVQQVFDISTGKDSKVGLKLTIAKYYTPSGRSIDGTGIKVDYEVELSNAEQNALLRDMRTKRYGDLMDEPPKDKEKESRIIYEIPGKQFIDRQLEMARFLLRSKLLGFHVAPASRPTSKKAA